VESSTRGSSGACEEMELGTGESAIRTNGREVVLTVLATGVWSRGLVVSTVATGMESGTGW
jgi:hypothetical protein